jgi:GNAT superfamily N-acetyltransferase
MLITYRRESWEPFWAQAKPLLVAHYREIAHYQDIPLVVDTARYEYMERVGALRVYVARRGSRMVGYCIMIVQPHAHYATSLQAAQDVIYVDKAFRRGRVGLRLIEFVEQELKHDGVQVVFQHVKKAHPALGRLLAHLGYEPQDVIYSKRLD